MKKKLSFIVVAILFALSAKAQETTYKIGDESAELGGYVFYVDLTGKHGLVCPYIDQGELEWGCQDKGIRGADKAGIYDGKQNTLDIITGCSSANTTAKICNDLVLYGFDDWYLPSKYELELMYINLHKKGLGNFAADWYWSSTEYDNNEAWAQSFSDGYQLDDSKKSSKGRVRAVRAF